jgi:hypothetical protein
MPADGDLADVVTTRAADPTQGGRPGVAMQDLDAHHAPLRASLAAAAARVLASGRYVLGPDAPETPEERERASRLQRWSRERSTARWL